jgi:hypothetical protein
LTPWLTPTYHLKMHEETQLDSVVPDRFLPSMCCSIGVRLVKIDIYDKE